MHEPFASDHHCPFCGQPDVFLEYIEHDGPNKPLYNVVCRDCKSTGPWAVGEELAVATWKSRPEYPLEHFECDGWTPYPEKELGRDEVHLQGCEGCPFCGRREIACFGEEGYGSCTTLCRCCGTTGPEGRTLEEATQLWNRRFRKPRAKQRFDGPLQTN